MSAAPTRRWLGRAIGHPVAFLLVINTACAALGLAQFAFALTVLAPADFAVIGVLAAIGGVITGLFDVKLAELTTKLFFAAPKEEPARRAALLGASLALHVAMGLASGAITFGIAMLLARRFLQQDMTAWWAAAMATRIGVGYPIGAVTASLRLVGGFRASGWARLAAQVAVSVTAVGALVVSPDLDGYFAGTALGTLLALVVAVTAGVVGTRRALGVSILGAASRGALASLAGGRGFLAGGSLLGMARLLSQSADTLLVAAFGDDTATGLYRIARQAYDNLAGLVDAVHQFYTPVIVDCVSNRRWGEYRRHRERLMVIAIAATFGVLAAAHLLLAPIAAARYPHLMPAVAAFEVLAGLLIVSLGVHSWLWPALVAEGRVVRLGACAVAGALLQLGAVVLLGRAGLLTPAAAAATAWLMAAATYGPLAAGRVLRRLRAAWGGAR